MTLSGCYYFEGCDLLLDRIYLDNAATTKPSEAAVEAAMDAVKRNYGNPSSKHLMGLEAERIINGARKEIAAKLGVDMNNIFYLRRYRKQ